MPVKPNPVELGYRTTIIGPSPHLGWAFLPLMCVLSTGLVRTRHASVFAACLFVSCAGVVWAVSGCFLHRRRPAAIAFFAIAAAINILGIMFSLLCTWM